MANDEPLLRVVVTRNHGCMFADCPLCVLLHDDLRVLTHTPRLNALVRVNPMNKGTLPAHGDIIDSLCFFL
jgi:hypothetical protein